MYTYLLVRKKDAHRNSHQVKKGIKRYSITNNIEQNNIYLHVTEHNKKYLQIKVTTRRKIKKDKKSAKQRHRKYLIDRICPSGVIKIIQSNQ